MTRDPREADVSGAKKMKLVKNVATEPLKAPSEPQPNPERCMCSHLKRSHNKGGCTMTSGFLTGGECDCVKFRPEEFAS